MCQSARVYRSYLKKLHQKNEKATIQNEKFEKQSEELQDRTRSIANHFCDWVQDIPGEDVNCNPKEDDILSWFAIGQDALEFQESLMCAAANNSNRQENENAYIVDNSSSKVKLPPKATQSSHHHSNSEAHSGVKTTNKKQETLRNKNGDGAALTTDELQEIQTKKIELETKLHNLNSTALLRDFKNRQNCVTLDRNVNNNSNYMI